jgi:hypothetical protein
MYFLEKRNGYLYLNKAGQKLLNEFYKPPRQHGKKHLEQWQKLNSPKK